MHSRYSNTLTLVSAILAFLPILAVDVLIDNHVHTSSTNRLQERADMLAASVHDNVVGVLDSLQSLVADGASLCTSTFVDQAQREVQGSVALKQITVENADRVLYCDAFQSDFTYSPVSEPFPLPGRAESLQLVMIDTYERPVFKLSLPVGADRVVSAFVPSLRQSLAMLGGDLQDATAIRLVLADGRQVNSYGDMAIMESSDAVKANAYVEELPLTLEAAASFPHLRAEYGDLDVGLTVVTALLCAAFLFLSLQYVRSTQPPVFNLERAISRGEIKPYYQPVINLRTGELLGCEVLCRWVRRNGQVIPPGQFIEQAEASGLAVPMTLSLMEQVKADLGEVAEQRPQMKIAINLFDGHFRDASIVDDVQAIFSNSSIRYGQLVFEITERQPIQQSLQSTSVISGLHALGARLAMDDVGTGHSNLAFMATLGVDIIKIDRVFIDMIKPGVSQVPVLDGLITMARDLDTEIVAEGVETAEQALYLRSRGVYQAQGFLFSPALKASAFLELTKALPTPGYDSPQMSAA
ncbi:hypothetical protein GCM10007989_02510 [Devosia pacifica]|uniref:EAL domain-containing protein n=1 Tax=Devosia pacifica TaxID=1335967 RepID=A0A918VN38_9HYPH|nr:EAL domain-containing protein [Devosia pacifica]GHA11692.1 hypothetical protein GCM10007989_02510 [Devosia pacifica]